MWKDWLLLKKLHTIKSTITIIANISILILKLSVTEDVVHSSATEPLHGFNQMQNWKKKISKTFKIEHWKKDECKTEVFDSVRVHLQDQYQMFVQKLL